VSLAREVFFSRARLALTIFITLLALPSNADYQTGLEAYQNGDFATAIAEWQDEVETPLGTADPRTRAETLYAIGMLFWLGQGVQQDTVESASWLKLAAEMYHVDAQNKLAYLYSTGQGVRQSNFEALKWWQMAANQGHADAQYNLGVLYRDGQGVEPNANESLKWFHEAVANGDPVSVGVIENYEQTGSLLTIDGTRLVPVPENEKWPVVASVSSAVPTEIGVAEPADDIVNSEEPEVVASSDDNRPAENEVIQKWPVVVTALPEANEPQPQVNIRSEVTNEDWIRQREPGHYTIQVIALSKPDKLQEYIQQHPDLAPFALYAQTRYKQPLWVMVQGDYPDVESARRAVRDFPQDMQKRDKLWIRLFSMVQSLLE